MKNLSTYLTQALNEKDEPKKETTQPGLKETLNNVEDKESLLKLLSNLDFNYKTSSATYNGKPYDKKTLQKIFKDVLEDEDFKKIFDSCKNEIKLKNGDKDSETAKGFLKFIDEIRQQLKSGKSGPGGYDKSEEDFRKLGEAIVFRTACSFSKNVDDFSQICKQIFDNDSDDRIKSLTTIETQLGEYGAIKGYKEYKEKNEKTNDDEAKSILERCEPFYQKLLDQSTPDVEVLDAIDQISASIPQEFKKYYEKAQGAFEEGRKTMSEEIKKPDFDWKDPITGKKAEGVDNIKAGMQKLANKLGAKADELGKKIMGSQHNLENDMMKVGVLAFKVMLGGVKGIRKALNFLGFGKRSASADAFIKGCKDSKSSITTLLSKFKSFLSGNKDFWKAFKNLSNKSDNKTSGAGINASYEMKFSDFILNEEEQKQTGEQKPAEGQPENKDKNKKEEQNKEDKQFQDAREKFFNDPSGFKNTGYHILDYITKNICFLIKLANGEDLKICTIEKIENAGENTYGLNFTKSGSMTMIQDKLNLYIKSLQFYLQFCDTIEKNVSKDILNKLYIGDLQATPNVFDFNRTQLLKSCDKILNNEDLKQNEKIKKAFTDIKLLYMEKEGFFQITKDWLTIKKNPKGFSSDGKNLLTFKQKVQDTINRLSKLKIEPLSEAAPINFKSEEDYQKFTKDLTKAFGGNFAPFKTDDEESYTNDSIKSQYDEIKKSVEELKDVNKLEDVEGKFETINDKVNTTLKSIEDMVAKLPDDDERKAKVENIKIDKEKTLNKIIYIKAAMSALNLKESVALNDIINLLNEAEETNTNFDNIKNEINDILNDEITLDNVEAMSNKAEAIYKNIDELYNKLNDETKKKLEKYKGIKLLYAISSISKDADNNNNQQDDTQKIQKFIDETQNIIKNITPEKIANDKFYDNLANAFKKTEDGIETWCGDNEKRLELYTSKQFPDNIKEDIIPKVWNAKSFLTTVFNDNKKQVKDSYNPFYAFDFLMLLEADEPDNNNGGDKKPEDNKEDKKPDTKERYTKACSLIQTLLGFNEEKKFIDEYTKWKENVINLAKEFGDKINADEKEPVKILSQIGIVISQNGNEQKENPQNTQEGDKSGDNT